jgi:hypothetical protein
MTTIDGSRGDVVLMGAAVGASLKDVVSQFSYDLAPVTALVGAFYTVQLESVPKIHMWTLLRERDETSEVRLAAAERRLLESFPMVRFDFTTAHLRGRDPDHFVPEGAFPIEVTR